MHPNSTGFATLENDKRWIAEVKMNGWRAVIIRDDEELIWNKHGSLISDPLPIIRSALRGLPIGTVLDAELIWSRRVEGVMDGLYVFDLLYYMGETVVDLQFKDRRRLLEDLWGNWETPESITLARQVQVGKRLLYEQSITDPLTEGIVCKRLDSRYPIGVTKVLDNPYWVKVKRVEKHIFNGKEAV
jgi:ATP-dependent DNA ligase